MARPYQRLEPKDEISYEVSDLYEEDEDEDEKEEKGDDNEGGLETEFITNPLDDKSKARGKVRSKYAHEVEHRTKSSRRVGSEHKSSQIVRPRPQALDACRSKGMKPLDASFPSPEFRRVACSCLKSDNCVLVSYDRYGHSLRSRNNHGSDRNHSTLRSFIGFVSSNEPLLERLGMRSRSSAPDHLEKSRKWYEEGLKERWTNSCSARMIGSMVLPRKFPYTIETRLEAKDITPHCPVYKSKIFYALLFILTPTSDFVNGGRAGDAGKLTFVGCWGWYVKKSWIRKSVWGSNWDFGDGHDKKKLASTAKEYTSERNEGILKSIPEPSARDRARQRANSKPKDEERNEKNVIAPPSLPAQSPRRPQSTPQTRLGPNHLRRSNPNPRAVGGHHSEDTEIRLQPSPAPSVVLLHRQSSAARPSKQNHGAAESLVRQSSPRAPPSNFRLSSSTIGAGSNWENVEIHFRPSPAPAAVPIRHGNYENVFLPEATPAPIRSGVDRRPQTSAGPAVSPHGDNNNSFREATTPAPVRSGIDITRPQSSAGRPIPLPYSDWQDVSRRSSTPGPNDHTREHSLTQRLGSSRNGEYDNPLLSQPAPASASFDNENTPTRLERILAKFEVREDRGGTFNNAFPPQVGPRPIRFDGGIAQRQRLAAGFAPTRDSDYDNGLAPEPTPGPSRSGFNPSRESTWTSTPHPRPTSSVYDDYNNGFAGESMPEPSRFRFNPSRASTSTSNQRPTSSLYDYHYNGFMASPSLAPDEDSDRSSTHWQNSVHSPGQYAEFNRNPFGHLSPSTRTPGVPQYANPFAPLPPLAPPRSHTAPLPPSPLFRPPIGTSQEYSTTPIYPPPLSPYLHLGHQNNNHSQDHSQPHSPPINLHRRTTSPNFPHIQPPPLHLHPALRRPNTANPDTHYPPHIQTHSSHNPLNPFHNDNANLSPVPNEDTASLVTDDTDTRSFLWKPRSVQKREEHEQVFRSSRLRGDRRMNGRERFAEYQPLVEDEFEGDNDEDSDVDDDESDIEIVDD